MKLGRTVRDADVKHLLWLREQIGSDLLDAAVLHTSPEAYRREDGISLEHRTTAPSTPLVAEPEPPGYLRSRRVSHRSAIRRIECATGDAAVADSSNVAFLLGLFGEQWNRAAASSPLNHGHGR